MKFLTLSLLIACTSCSLFKGVNRKISIDSNLPDSTVSVYSNDKKSFLELGKTPLEIDSSTIKGWMKEHDEYVVLRVTKSGHAVENLFIDLSSRHQVEFKANMKPLELWNDKEAERSSTVANKLAIKIQSINQQIFTKSYDEALRETNTLVGQYPKAHVFYDMRGSIYLLMGRTNEAVASYQKSLSLNPDNSEAKKTLEKLRRND